MYTYLDISQTDFTYMNIEEFRDAVLKDRERLLEDALEFIRMPSISATGEGIEETAKYLRDFIVDRLGGEASLERYGGHPIVYGYVGSEMESAIFYGMYDVQPVEPLDKWIVDPFAGAIVEDKIIARGAYNTKGSLIASLLGLEKYIEVFGKPPMRIFFIIEGEEELGSPSMPKIVEDKRDDISSAKTVLFTFPTEFIPGKPAVILGNKGIIYIDVKVKTSEYDIHSSYARGLYNPAVILAKIVESLIDPIKGPKPEWLYTGFREPTEEELKYIDEIIDAMPPEHLKEAYGIYRFRFDDIRELVKEVIFYPSVNVDGFCSGYCGEGTKTIVPSEGVLKIDFRLVPDMEPDTIYEKFLMHINELGLKEYVDVILRDSYTWSQTPPDSLSAKTAKKGLELLGLEPKIVYRLPGSAPMYLFTRRLGIDVVSVGPGHGGRAHAPNEYITVDTIPKTAVFTPTYYHMFREAIAGG